MNKLDLRKLINDFNPYNEQEESDKELMLNFIDNFDDVVTRENKLGHFTASCFILNEEMDKVIFIYHNIYKSWAWVGGHADGEYDLLSVAIKEAKEETGLDKIDVIKNEPISIEALTVDPHIKRGKYVSSHIHMDLCYLLKASELDLLKIKPDENSGVKWFPLDEVEAVSNEEMMKPIYNKIISKIKNIRKKW